MTSKTLPVTHSDVDKLLFDRFDQGAARTDLGPDFGCAVEVRSYDFTSANWRVHPADDYAHTDPTVKALLNYYLEQSPYSNKYFFQQLQSSDREITENRRFRYSVFAPKRRGASQSERFTRGTLLFHGLNERSWRKYLPWALRLVELTGRPVVLFPIAFHMNRTPPAWANPREMMRVARERQRLFPGLSSSSFVNAALSHRIQFAPHRFLTSGLQTYYDVTDLVSVMAAGGHELFAHGARVDLFGYSIGASLAQWLLMQDPQSLFSDSRAVLFCGGAVMDQASPVSRAIIDAEAYHSLTRFFEELATDNTQLGEDGPAAERETEVLKSLLFTDTLRELREAALQRICDRVTAVGLAQDSVFYPAGLTGSWRDHDRAALMRVDILDPPYRYSHEDPFPVVGEDPKEVDRAFREVMSRAAQQLGA
ncbi:MAG: hypothetical protein GVY29_00190 [Spirochaetes bacterium]|jgi:pimeloyl-ACP methyl ester carboxylesterase|nr:hypothetical protein [Spirochaetota bacterium]